MIDDEHSILQMVVEVPNKSTFPSSFAYSSPEIQIIAKEETSAVVQNLKENKICVMSASSSHEKPWKLSFKLKLKQSCKVFNEIEKEEKVSAFDFRCGDCQVAIGYESGLTWIYDSEGREIHNLKGLSLYR